MKKTSPSKRLLLSLSALLVLLTLFFALPATASSAKATQYAKVKVSSAKLYKSISNQRTHVLLKKGATLTVIGVKGSWAKVRVGTRSGFIQLKSIAKVQKAKKKLRMLSRGSKGADVLAIQKRLVQLGYMNKRYANGRFGAATQCAIRKFQLLHLKRDTGKASASLQRALLAGNASKMPGIINAPWSNQNISSNFGVNDIATIIDVRTGISLKVRRLFGSNHLDVEPAAKSDTSKLKRIYGGEWSWESRGVLLRANGKWFAASINSMPHGQQSGVSNGYNGQFCIHLRNSKTHGSNKINFAHQRKIRSVVSYFKKYN